MDDKLSIVALPQQTHLLLKVSGRVDGYWSKYLDEYLVNTLREGHHSVALDLSGVNYMSSLGIRILIKHAKIFRQINGLFGIATTSEMVGSLLKMAGLDAILAWHEQKPTLQKNYKPVLFEADGFSYEFETIQSDHDMQCMLFGNPGQMLDEGFTAADNKVVAFGSKRFGLGLGATGKDFDDCRDRYGEFVALGNALVYLPAGTSGTPDYMLKTGAFIPTVNMLYGIAFEGGFEQILRFQPCDAGNSARFSNLLSRMFEHTGHDKLAMVMLAEIHGLVGVSLRKSPANALQKGKSLFGFPDIRDNINFTTEPAYNGMMAVVAGIAVKAGTEAGDYEAFLKPVAPGSQYLQHFHAAIFSYHPIRKTNIDLQECIDTLFEEDKILSVMHLVNDTREITGAGETEFKNGVAWISEIHSLKKS